MTYTGKKGKKVRKKGGGEIDEMIEGREKIEGINIEGENIKRKGKK